MAIAPERTKPSSSGLNWKYLAISPMETTPITGQNINSANPKPFLILKIQLR